MKLWTNSRRYAKQLCDYYHHMTYVAGWRKRPKQEEPLYDGTIWHRCMENWWDRAEMPEDYRLKRALLPIEGAYDVPAAAVRMEELVRGYHIMWISNIDKAEVVSIEGEFGVPLINPKTGAKSRTWTTGGKYDVLARDNQQRLWNIEHKTTSEDILDPVSDYWLLKAMDTQTSQYWEPGAPQQASGGEVPDGEEIYGTLFDVARKLDGANKPKIKGSPRKYTAKKQSKDESDASFAARSDDDGLGAPESDSAFAARRETLRETLDEFRLRMRAKIAENPAAYYQRHPVPRTQSQLDDYRLSRWMLAKSAHEDERAGNCPKNPDACMKWGKPCIFFEHCATGTELVEDPNWEKLDWPHPELNMENFPEANTQTESEEF